MAKRFKKLMREQVQANLNDLSPLAHKDAPRKGWVNTIRQALGMSSQALADRLGCSRSNVTAIEHRERKGTISLETLEQVARAMNCKLVYGLVPLEPLDTLLEKQARMLAKKRIRVTNHSMKLEEQGLNKKQLQQQEDDLVKELLEGNPRDLWNNDEI